MRPKLVADVREGCSRHGMDEGNDSSTEPGHGHSAIVFLKDIGPAARISLYLSTS